MPDRFTAALAAPAANATPTSSTALFGGRSARSFLAGFWQKQALLVRDAVPGFTGPLDAGRLMALAQRDDVESRLVVRDGVRWSLAHGPFKRADFKALPERNWTLLVQGVNLHDAASAALLRRFACLPYARLDDVMASYAAPGGGVGAHCDSYDVFLLQGSGRRRWRYGRQRDLALRRGLPLKILRRFAPEHDDVLAAGDMLYLPPDVAHDGVALEHCTTWSIGFRAPGTAELAHAFLDFLRDEIDLPGRYADPDLAPTRAPARVGAPMQRRCAKMLAQIRWDRATIERFLGGDLSEPKPSVFFEPPAKPLARTVFVRRAARHGVQLNARTRLLYDDRNLYVNGLALAPPAEGSAALRRLADARRLGPREAGALPAAIAALLYQWYRHGFLAPGPD